MDSHQINNQLKSGEKYNRNKRNTQSNKKQKEKHQEINEENIIHRQERLNEMNNSEDTTYAVNHNNVIYNLTIKFTQKK